MFIVQVGQDLLTLETYDRGLEVNDARELIERTTPETCGPPGQI